MITKTRWLDHLRPFDLELAKQGHPMAWEDGCEVSYYFQGRAGMVDTVWLWRNFYQHWTERGMYDGCKDSLRLAPLAIKDGKPLHIGDVVNVLFANNQWLATTVAVGSRHEIVNTVAVVLEYSGDIFFNDAFGCHQEIVI